MDPRSLRRVTVSDIVLILVILLFAGASLARLWPASAERAVARVYLEGELVEVLPLDRDRVAVLPDRANGVRVEVLDGRVRILESDCPKRICVRSGWIHRPGQTIVCVPRKLIVQLQGFSSEYDAETY